MNDLPLLLGLDLGGVIFLLFAFISFISWLMNQVKGAKQVPPPRRPQPQPGQRNPQVQREIERFLREAGGQQQRPGRPEVGVEEIEIVEAPAGRRPPQKRKVEKPRPAQAQRPATQSPKPSADRPGQRFADRHLAAAPKSTVSSAHLSQRTGSGNLTGDVSKSVSKHLGIFAAAENEITRREQPVISAAFLTELRSPRGIRNAIIMQEILQRPRALRRPAK